MPSALRTFVAALMVQNLPAVLRPHLIDIADFHHHAQSDLGDLSLWHSADQVLSHLSLPEGIVPSENALILRFIDRHRGLLSHVQRAALERADDVDLVRQTVTFALQHGLAGLDVNSTDVADAAPSGVGPDSATITGTSAPIAGSNDAETMSDTAPSAPDLWGADTPSEDGESARRARRQSRGGGQDNLSDPHGFIAGNDDAFMASLDRLTM